MLFFHNIQEEIMTPLSIPQIQGVSETFWKMCKTISQWVGTTIQRNQSYTTTHFLNSTQNTITQKGIYSQTVSHPWKKTECNCTTQNCNGSQMNQMTHCQRSSVQWNFTKDQKVCNLLSYSVRMLFNVINPPDLQYLQHSWLILLTALLLILILQLQN